MQALAFRAGAERKQSALQQRHCTLKQRARSHHIPIETDIVIVGAGAAGLSAAKELRQHGVGCVVLEAADRIGGRAHTQEVQPGLWFDRGCGYLHDGTTNPFVPIAESLGIPLNHACSQAFVNSRAFRDGQPLSEQEAEDFAQYVQRCYDAINASVARGEDKALSDLLETGSPFFLPFARLLNAINSRDIEETSAPDYAAFAAGEDAPSDIPVPGGFGSLVAAWGADVVVTLNCAAQKIEWSRDGVRVETDQGTLKARYALLTVSTGVLASDAIRFEPELPDWKRDAIHSLPMGALCKVGLFFDTDVFGPDGRASYTSWTSSGDTGFIDADLNHKNLAIVFTGGTQGAELERQGAEAAQAVALDRVADVFGNAIRKHVKHGVVTDWTHDPFHLGAYSAARPGRADQRPILAKPVDEVLFFAGEATMEHSVATCHGAYYSGQRAAKALLAALGRATVE